MAQYPALPLWTDAYLADTTHLTAIEHGVYLLLLITMWRAGGTLPNDDKTLARYGRVTMGQWLRIKPNLMPFFRISSDGITQGRLTDELVYVKRKGKKQSDNARARWLKNNDTADAVAVPDGCPDDAGSMPDGCPHTHTHLEGDKSPSLMPEKASEKGGKAKGRPTYPEPFEAFWRSYPTTPNMSKAKTLDAWRKLDGEDCAAAEGAIRRYRAFLESKPDHPVMHATTFLNERRFDGFSEQDSVAAPKAVTAADWQKRLTYGREKQQWHIGAWGPMPGAAGCLVPEHLLQPNDGQEWAAWEA